MDKAERNLLRLAFALYVKSEGCSCCRDNEEHEEAAAAIGKLLKVPKYKDGSGYDFWKFLPKEKTR